VTAWQRPNGTATGSEIIGTFAENGTTLSSRGTQMSTWSGYCQV